jgi:hypothetical protein
MVKVTVNTPGANRVSVSGQNSQVVKQVGVESGTALKALETANQALILAQAAGNTVSAFNQANTALATAQSAFGRANTGLSTAQSAFGQANTGLITAQAAFNAANSAVTDFSPAFNQANLALATAQTAFSQANAAPGIANSYATVVGASSNSWANSIVTSANNFAGTMANSANGRANTVGASANAWANTIVTSANNFAGTMANSANGRANTVGASANAWANSIVTSANNFAGTMANSSNGRANTVGASANAYATLVGASANGWSNTKVSSSGGTITGDLSITGNLAVSGNTSFISVTNFRVDDPLLYLAGNNYVSDIVDIGFIANYVNATGANVHTGLYREHEDKMYYLFQGYDREPANNHIGAFSNNMTLSVLNADLRTSNLVLFGANAQQFIISAHNQANAAFTYAGAAFTNANTTLVTASAAFAQSNAAFITASAAYEAANAASDIANSYATSVGTSGNSYALATATAIGAAGNAYATTVGTSANAYATAVGAGGNTYTLAAFNRANSSVQYTVPGTYSLNTKQSFAQSNGSAGINLLANNTLGFSPSLPPTLVNGDLWLNDFNGILYFKSAAGSTPRTLVSLQPSQTYSNGAKQTFAHAANGNAGLRISDATPAPNTAAAVNGDIWLVTGDSRFSAKLNNRAVYLSTNVEVDIVNITAIAAFDKANTGMVSSNVFTSNVVITVSDNTNAALRITQTGAGNALLVEDETNPDSSPFVVSNTGNVLVGRTTSTVGQSVKLDVAGAINASAILVNSAPITFLNLADTPANYTNSSNLLVAVNNSANGLAYIDTIIISDFTLEAEVAPLTPAANAMTIYVTTSGATPNKEVAFKIKNEAGEEVILSSILV